MYLNMLLIVAVKDQKTKVAKVYFFCFHIKHDKRETLI